MRFLVLGLFAFGLAYSPVYLMEKFVQPQLDEMKYQYSHAEEIANKAASVDTYKNHSSGL
ncbi:MAG TPA: hypothetical protein VFW77_01500 [Candidatus Saccharimonadales bacterium]|nr:hypothetical protein [Candidatus Saccharimonadales bacterium]